MQGSYRHYNTFFQDFSRLAKTKFHGFPALKKTFFKDFPGYIPFTNTGHMRSKKCTYQISYRCICIINVFLILDLTQEVATYHNQFLNLLIDYSNHKLTFPERLLYNSRTFPGPMPFSRIFQHCKSQQFNSMTFQGLYKPCKFDIDRCI